MLILTISAVFAQKAEILPVNIRGLADTVGFAHKAWQMDSVIQRIDRNFSGMIEQNLKKAKIQTNTAWKAVISPHDDYAFAGQLYFEALKNIKAPVVILIGVSHKAWKYELENKLL
ncbi:MAG: MEMO1 family protein, partial [Bacteroidia bacterium]|nr:MEMO1 family protein [Bacteroidia bacterium]